MPRGGRRSYDRPGSHPTILVADPYQDARLPVVRYLRRYHFGVIEAADGEQALQQVVAAAPQVILAEWSLPLMPPPRLRQWLDQSWRARALPVIIMIGDCEPGDSIPPVAGMLIKPFPLATMVDEIRRVIRLQEPPLV